MIKSALIRNYELYQLHFMEFEILLFGSFKWEMKLKLKSFALMLDLCIEIIVVTFRCCIYLSVWLCYAFGWYLIYELQMSSIFP